MTTPTTQQQAADYALRMILAIAEGQDAEFQRLALAVDRHRNKKLAGLVILGITATAASAYKAAHPETWSAELRMSLHDLDMDPERWTTDQPGSNEGKEQA